MPSKGNHSIAQKHQLEQSRHVHESSATAIDSVEQARPRHDSSAAAVESIQDIVAELKGRLQEAEERCVVLEQSLQAEHALAQEAERCAATLAQELSDERKHTETFAALLNAERAHSKELYHKLRVERQARQRGQQRKVELEEQIKGLKVKGIKKSDTLTTKEAKEQTPKDTRTYNLLYKGVYTEDTRRLIQLIVQAGCSREHVSKVIHAVLGAAGITVKGKISRHTVSRVILEGYYAAQVQLGYEMQMTKGIYPLNFCSTHF